MTRMVLLIVTALTCAAQNARAEDGPHNLPGVEGGHSIVKPLPEPDELPVNEDGSIQLGKTRVKISGSVTVDIGVGAARESGK